jgi:hypothetical protein
MVAGQNSAAPKYAHDYFAITEQGENEIANSS